MTMYGNFAKPLFSAKEEAKWIEHSDVSTMIRSVETDEKLIQTIFVSGQNREACFVTKYGV